MYYDPMTDRFPYTEYTDRHYLKLKKDDGTVFDKDYPYIDRSAKRRFLEFIGRAGLVCVAMPVMAIRTGLRIKGRKNLKANRDILRSGVVSVCNHVHMMDYICILNAIRPFKPHFLAWAPNVRGENGKMIRMVGGVPIPENDFHATAACNKALADDISAGGWLHIYAEGSMWEYYRPIRPFKTGAAYFACKCCKPILPLAYTYRKPGFIRRVIFRQIANLTVHIGEPIFPDESLKNMSDRMRDLTERSHAAVCELAGFAPGENIYPPVFNGNRRIDYYTSVYGIGYRGSH